MKEWFLKNWSQVVVIIGVGLIIYFIFHKSPDVSEVNQYKINELNEQINIKNHIIDSLTNTLVDIHSTEHQRDDSIAKATLDAINKTVYELRQKKAVINTDTLSSTQLRDFFSALR